MKLWTIQGSGFLNIYFSGKNDNILTVGARSSMVRFRMVGPCEESQQVSSALLNLVLGQRGRAAHMSSKDQGLLVRRRGIGHGVVQMSHSAAEMRIR